MKPATRQCRWLITCEHGGNRIPARYRALFRPHAALLASHRGYDPGALLVARDFSAAFGVPLVSATTSRLLVELNRSAHHRQLFSPVTRTLPSVEKALLLERYYHPYRETVEKHIRAVLARGGCVVHVSCHSFTPQLDGLERRADIGLLYDPKRNAERALALRWQDALRRAQSGLVVRRNYPYRGYDDGLTTYLRTRFPDPRYAGIELEVNQKYPLGPPSAWRRLRGVLVKSLRPLLG